VLFPHKQPYSIETVTVLEKVVIALTTYTILAEVHAVSLHSVPYEVTGTTNLYPVTIVIVSDVVDDTAFLACFYTVTAVLISGVVDDIIVLWSMDSVISVVVGNVVINITEITKIHPSRTVAKSNNPSIRQLWAPPRPSPTLKSVIVPFRMTILS